MRLRPLLGRRRAAVHPVPAALVLDSLTPDRERVVRTRDGVGLHVEEDGPGAAPLTVVFVHGFTARLAEWDLQRVALRGRPGTRLVLFDQRGHGRSEVGDLRRATIDQLGEDLADVLDAVVPTGPVVLAGHSMGGMSVMAWVRQHPGQLRARVVGVFVMATSAGSLVTTGPLGLWAKVLTRTRLLRPSLRLLQACTPLLERLRRRGTAAGYAFTRHYLFGADDVDPGLVRAVQDLLEESPLTVQAAFWPAFVEHDERAALPLLRRVPVAVVCGDDDRLTPVSHNRAIAAATGAELTVVPGAGHSVNISNQEVVDAALLRLVERAVDATRPGAAGAA